MHCPFFKVGYLILFFFKNVPNNLFSLKKRIKERKISLLLYATAKIGEMALAYLKSWFEKKKACLGSHCDSAKYIYVHPSYKTSMC